MLTFTSLSSLFNSSTNWLIELIINFFFIQVLPLMWRLISAPFTNPSMLWIVTPLLISMTLMQLYFARHRQEELGWNTAFGNSISLIFVSVNLMQFLYNSYGFAGLNLLSPASNKLYLIVIIALISAVQVVTNYYHSMPKKIAFFINSSIPTNITAYVAIILVYTSIPFTISTIIASILLLAIMLYLFSLIKNLIPMSREAESYIKSQEEKSLRKKAWVEKMELRQERAGETNLVDALAAIGSLVIVFLALMFASSFIELPVWATPLIQGVTYLLITIILLLKRGLSIKNLNYDGEPREFLIGLSIGFPLFFLVNTFAYLFLRFMPGIDLVALLNTPIISDSHLINFLIFVLLTPIANELLFRGVIQRSLKGKLGHHRAVIIQGFLFGLINFSFAIFKGLPSLFVLVTAPALIIAGLILGYLRDKWGLESSIMAHVSYNTIGFLLSVL